VTGNLETTFTIDRFESGDIDASQFDHEAHIYVAWLYIKRFGPETAACRFDAALRRLTRQIGAAAKYDAIITWLFLKLLAERARADEDWPGFRARNADLVDEFPRQRAA
jgi:hypothetical protein